MERLRSSITPPPGSTSPLSTPILHDLNSNGQFQRSNSKQNILQRAFKQDIAQDAALSKSNSNSSRQAPEYKLSRPTSPNLNRSPSSRSVMESRSSSTASKKSVYVNTKSRIDSGIKGKRSATPKFIPVLKSRSNLELSRSYMSERPLTPTLEDSRGNLNGVDVLYQEAKIRRKQGQISPIKAIKDFFVKISKASDSDTEPYPELKEKIELVLELIYSYRALSPSSMHPSFDKMIRVVQDIQAQLNHNHFIPLSLLIQCDEIIASLEAQTTTNCFSPAVCTRKGLEDAEDILNLSISRVTVKTLKDFRSNKLPNQDIRALTQSFLVLVSQVDSHVDVSSGFKVMKSRLWEALQNYTSSVGQAVQTIRKLPDFIKEGKITENVVCEAYSHFSQINLTVIRKTEGAEEIMNLLRDTFDYYGRFKEFKNIHPQEVPSLPLYKLSPSKASPKKESSLGQSSIFYKSGSKLNTRTESAGIEVPEDKAGQERKDTPRFAFSTEGNKFQQQSPQKTCPFELTLSKGLGFENSELNLDFPIDSEHSLEIAESEAKSSPQIIIDTQDELEEIMDTRESVQDSIVMFESVQDSATPSELVNEPFNSYSTPVKRVKEEYFISPEEVSSSVRVFEEQFSTEVKVITAEPDSSPRILKEATNKCMYLDLPRSASNSKSTLLDKFFSRNGIQVYSTQSENISNDTTLRSLDSLAYSSKDSPDKEDIQNLSMISSQTCSYVHTLESYESPRSDKAKDLPLRSSSSFCLSNRYCNARSGKKQKKVTIQDSKDDGSQWKELREVKIIQKKKKAEEDKRKQLIEESKSKRGVEEKFQALMAEKIRKEKEMIKQSKIQNFEESKRIKALKDEEKKKELYDELQRNVEKSELAKNSKDIEKGLLRKSETSMVTQKADNENFQKLILRSQEGVDNKITEKIEYNQAQRGLIKEQQKLQRILSRLTKN